MKAGFKDTEFAKWGVGVVTPVALVGIACVNFALGKAVIYTRSQFFEVITVPLAAYAIGIMKIGGAIALFSWFFLANDDVLERYANVGVLVGVIVIVCASVLVAVGMIMG